MITGSNYTAPRRPSAIQNCFSVLQWLLLYIAGLGGATLIVVGIGVCAKILWYLLNIGWNWF